MGSVRRAVEVWNKIQKQLKKMLFKDLFPNEIKTVVKNVYQLPFNNFNDHLKIYMTLLVPKTFRVIVLIIKHTC